MFQSWLVVSDLQSDTYGNFYLLLAIKAFNSYQIQNMKFTNSPIL